MIPSEVPRNRLINLDMYSYEPCGLPTGDHMPIEKSQIRLQTASPIMLRACIPAPDQVRPDESFFKDLNFYKQTLFHQPFLSRGRAVPLLEYRDVQVVFEVQEWFNLLPQGVQRYLLPLQSRYAKWYNEHVRDLTQNYSYCTLCNTKQTNLQRHHMRYHARWRTIWLCPLPGCPSSSSTKDGLIKHLTSPPHLRAADITLGRKVAKQIANQNCYWPVTQLMADKLLSSSKRLIRYVALYSMAGVAMEDRLFRIHPRSRDSPYIEACANYLTPKMHLSKVMPSGANSRKYALPRKDLPALSDRPSASDYNEDTVAIPEAQEDMRATLWTPIFQPYTGNSAKKWLEREYGATTSSVMSSSTERDDSDNDDIVSFDLGPADYEPVDGLARIPSDEYLDNIQQGLKPGGSEPRHDPLDRFLVMPNQPSIMDLMRTDIENAELNKSPTAQERGRPMETQMNWDFDFVKDEPPAVIHVPEETVRASTPRLQGARPQASIEGPPTLQVHEEPARTSTPRSHSVRPKEHIEQPRPRALSAPTNTNPAKRVALQYTPVTEEVTPPASPQRAQASTPVMATAVAPDSPPVAKHGRSRGRGSWRAQPRTASPTAGVGTRSQTRLLEKHQQYEEEAQAASTRWPPGRDRTETLQHLTREMKITDVPINTHRELERIFPSGEEDRPGTSTQPPAVGLIRRQQDTFFIPPPSRAVGGARGRSIPVSTATLGLIDRQNPALSALLREQPEALMSQRTRRRLYPAMRSVRTGLLCQMASLQQWEDAMNAQDEDM